MDLSSKIASRLSSNAWYHATTLDGFHNILEKGVLADFNRGRELDFGYGFYLTEKAKMAENYIARLPVEPGNRVIMEFEFTPISWFEGDEIQTEVFDAFDERFAEFVFCNRECGASGEQAHAFDAVYGGMSDSKPTLLLAGYRAGEVSREEVIQSLQKGTSMKQLSLHNQNLCDTIKLVRAYCYDPETNAREELDIHERKHEAVHC